MWTSRVIYMLDRRGTGLHIVALTGAAHDIVGLSH